MVSPYSTQPAPPFPRGTPSSASQIARALKPPIFNPYDKFTQPEFDTWIGDITGALRRALGHKESSRTRAFNAADVATRFGGRLSERDEEGTEDEAEESEVAEDSFAEIRTRRVTGKARDTREGPGFGGKDQPIEIDSDPRGDENVMGHGALPSEQNRDQEVEGEAIHFGLGTNAAEPIELESDEEDQLYEDGGYPNSEYRQGDAVWNQFTDWSRDFRARGQEHPVSWTPLGVHETSSEERRLESEASWEAGGDTEDFPPHSATSLSQPLNLSDPWEGPKTYAEDFYSGGDFREHDLALSRGSPSNLTPLREDVVRSIRLSDHREREDLNANGLAWSDVDREDDGPLPGSSPLPSSDVEVPADAAEETLDDIYADWDAEEVQQDTSSNAILDVFPPVDVSHPVEYLEISGCTEDDAMFREEMMVAHQILSSPGFYELPTVDGDGSDPGEAGALPLGTSDLGIDQDISVVFDGQDEEVLYIPDRDHIEDSPRREAEGTDVLPGNKSPSWNVLEFPRDTLVTEVPETENGEGDAPVYADRPPHETSTTISEPMEAIAIGLTTYTVIEVDSPCDQVHEARETYGDVDSVAGSATGEQIAYTVEESPHATLVESFGRALSPLLVSDVISVVTSDQNTRDSSVEASHIVPDTVSASKESVRESGYRSDEPQQKNNLQKSRRASETETTRDLPQGVPMPVSADPDIPDPASGSPPPSDQASTRVTDDFVQMEDAVLEGSTLEIPGASTSGLFTPSNEVESEPGTPHQPLPLDVFDAQERESMDEQRPPNVATAIVEPRATERSPASINGAVSHGLTQTSFLETVEPIALVMPPPGDLSRDTSQPSLVPTMQPPDANVPILYGDPFPYSLSTPGSEFFVAVPEGIEGHSDSRSDEENETSSSAMVENEFDSQVVSSGLLDTDLLAPIVDPLNIAYRSESSLSPFLPARQTEVEEEALKVSGIVGADTKQTPAVDPIQPPEPSAVEQDNVQEDARPDLDVFVVVEPGEADETAHAKENGVTAAQVAQDDGPLPDGEGTKDGMAQLSNHETLPGDKPVNGRTPKSDDGQATQDHSVPAPPRKRKRQSSIVVSLRRTRSSTSKASLHQELPEIGKVGKGKRREKALGHGDVGSVVDGQSTSSSAKSVIRLLGPLKTSVSRASSVSSASVDSSTATQHSPSSKSKVGDLNKHFNPPPLFHAHGPIRNKQNAPSHGSQIEPVDNQNHDHLRAEDTPADTSAPSQKSPTRSWLQDSSASSPVTRSNCRFHKISLPREEGGPRICFLVPGCSIGNRELMGSQEIEDHGFATIDDGDRSISDIESLEFSSYLIGILRQLVGVDLLREREVLYLPLPGEQQSRRRGRKSALARILPKDVAVSAAGSDSGRISPTTHASRNSSLSRYSISGNFTKPSKPAASEQDSQSDGPDSASESDGGNSKLSSPKGTKNEPTIIVPQNTKSAASSGVGAPVSPPVHQAARTRRSKRLGIDALEYKPDKEELIDTSDGDTLPVKGRRKKLPSRGIKRSRTKEGEDEDEGHSRQKKLRLTRSASAAEQRG